MAESRNNRAGGAIEITLGKETTTLKVNASEEITCNVTEGATWEVTSKDQAKVAVEEKGNDKIKITGKAEGRDVQVEIRANKADAEPNQVTKILKVTVQAAEKPATELTLNPETVTVKMGQPFAEVNVTTNANTISAESKNPGKATVTVEGKKIKVKPVAEGSGTIEVKATADGSKETVKTLNFTVQAADNQEQPEVQLTVEPTTVDLKKGGSKVLNITVEQEGNYQMVSEAAQTATVDQSQKKITAVEVGNTRVKITGTKTGRRDKVIYVTVNVTAEGTEEEPQTQSFEIKTKSIKGEKGSEVEILTDYPGELLITSSNRRVCYLKEKDGKTLVLHEVGSCTVTVQPKNDPDNSGVCKQIPIYVTKVFKERKMDYTTGEIRDLFLKHIRLEEGFIPGGKEDTILCQLDKEKKIVVEPNNKEVHIKGIIDRGIEEAKITIKDFKHANARVEFYVKNMFGPLKDDGSREEGQEYTRTYLIPFQSGEFNKSKIAEMYRLFQEFVREKYCL